MGCLDTLLFQMSIFASIQPICFKNCTFLPRRSEFISPITRSTSDIFWSFSVNKDVLAAFTMACSLFASRCSSNLPPHRCVSFMPPKISGRLVHTAKKIKPHPCACQSDSGFWKLTRQQVSWAKLGYVSWALSH